MKLSNFHMKKVQGNSPLTWVFFAEVDVTTGWLFKKTETKQIARDFVGFWGFVDTGEMLPLVESKELERSWVWKNCPLEKFKEAA